MVRNPVSFDDYQSNESTFFPAESATINLPTVYDGNKKKFNRFWQQVELYFIVEENESDTDDKKIAFVLSYPRKGNADLWAESFQAQKRQAAEKAGIDLTFGTWSQFEIDIKDAFSYEYAERDAICDLNRIVKQPHISTEDHVARFKSLVIKSQLKEEHSLIYTFQTSLPGWLRIAMSYADPPTSLEGWYKLAIQVDNIHKKIRQDSARYCRSFKQRLP